MYPYTHCIPLFHASFMEAGIPVPYRPSGEQAELGSLQFFYQPNCRDAVVYPVMLSILLWYNLFCSSLFSPEPISLPFFQVWLYHLFRDDSISVFPLKDIDILSETKDSSNHQQRHWRGSGRKQKNWDSLSIFW